MRYSYGLRVFGYVWMNYRFCESKYYIYLFLFIYLFCCAFVWSIQELDIELVK